MTTTTIRRGDPREPGATALLARSHKTMDALFPQEENHFLSIAELGARHIRFFLAERDGAVVGCGALADMGEYGEVKSMFVQDDARGRGVAARLLDRIEHQARALNLPVLRLETGDLLHGAHRLYARRGFDVCGPFGDYRDSPTSVFMEKRL